MKCIECKLYDINPLWNHCYLTDQDCFYTYDPCPYINDDYVCIIVLKCSFREQNKRIKVDGEWKIEKILKVYSVQ